jgi:asparagine synthase (glutamine-hydrolysing)
MCGIAGVALFKSAGDTVDQKLLTRMGDTLRHRGPDDGAVWISPNAQVGFAHRRLSIIDLSEAGRQPMRKGEAWITFNGEIYNYLELRDELAAAGHTFRGGSDTEVLLAAYREWGDGCLARLNGMFAFAIYDGAARRVLLARDRVGKKPLYYTFGPDRLVFGSELKALLQDPTVSTEMDLRALNFFLAYGYVPGDLSIFRSVRKLPPGHAIELDLTDGRARTWRYWSLPQQAAGPGDANELAEELAPLLEDAVRVRLRSDVPLGVFLSGGVDSSLVVGLMSKLASRPVETFTVGFEEAASDERRFARIVARHFGTHHHEVVIRPNVLQVLPELVQQLDEPFADPSIIPTYYVCRETRRSVTVALSGDGGDEVFGGYRKYVRTVRDAHLADVIPSWVRDCAAGATRVLGRGTKLREYARRLREDAGMNFVGRTLLFDEAARRRLFRPDVLAELDRGLGEPEAHLLATFETAAARDLVTRMTATDFAVYLPDDILVKVDRLSMLVSLEVRAPLLDHRVVEFSFGRVPARLKVNGAGKVLLKQVARRILPAELNVDRKSGFGIPLRAWLGEHDGELMDVLPAGLPRLFNPNSVEAVIRAGGRGLAKRDRHIFALLVLGLWSQAYGGLS